MLSMSYYYISFCLNISSLTLDTLWQAANMKEHQAHCAVCFCINLLLTGKWSIMVCLREASLLSHDIMTSSTHIGEQNDFGCTNVSVVWVKEETLYWTNPEAGEVRIGGIVGLVVSLHQGWDDPGLLLIQTWPHRLPGCLLFFPL